MIVVDVSENCEEDVEIQSQSTPNQSLDRDSPAGNPYLLSPFRDPRDTRKHSLPSQQVTDGITASQVRRLSERGGEAPSPKQVEFLATLSQAPQPSGRRHSVVTISKMPQNIFGKGRRESVAGMNRLLGSRRESTTSAGPPATDPIGSVHNLQLDIMDDIVQARKARMKLWNTSSEKVCEVQTVDESGASSPMRYTNRRYSDFVSSTLTPIPAAGNRRASENPCITSAMAAAGQSSAGAGAGAGGGGTTPSGSTSTAQKFFKKSGIVVTNTDLMSIISSLTSSATEINKVDEPTPTTFTSFTNSRTKPTSSNTLSTDPQTASAGAAGIGRSNRSNSFDVSILHNAKQMIAGGGSAADKSAAALSGWFEKRHQPMARKKSMKPTSTVSFTRDVLDRFKDKEERSSAAKETPKKSKSKSRWGDSRTAFVDPHVIGNAIEGFLRKGTSKGAVPKDSRSKKSSTGKSATSSTSAKSSSSSSSSFWFSKGDEDDSNDTCDSSLCTTLKDLFVK